MPTNIFNYDGTKLTTVPDARIDTTSASIKFPGYGYINYGEAVNENMLWIMQNFASDSEPARPTIGQTWYDRSNEILKVYDGNRWNEVGNLLKSPTPPSTTITGILWYDTVNKQINVWAENGWRLVGPLGSAINADPQNPPVPDYSSIDTVLLSDGVSTHPVWRIMLGGTIVAIVSKDDEFIPMPSVPGGGFVSIKKGLNFNSGLVNVGYYNDLGMWRNDQTNVPNVAGAYDLGSPGFGFNRIYAATFSGKADSAVSADVATASTSASIASNSNQLGGYGPEKYLMTNRNDLPDVDLTYDLGSASARWKDVHAGTVHANNIIVNGSMLEVGNIVSISGTANQITVTGTKNVTLSTPQNIGTSSSVRFASAGLGQPPGASGSLTFGDGTIQTTAWVPGITYDLNVSPPAGNINLLVGQRTVLKFTNFINIPLYTACQEGVYSVKLVCTATNSQNLDLQWFPNSVLSPVPISGDLFEATSILTDTSSGIFSTTPVSINVKQPYAFWFDLVDGPSDPVSDRGPFMMDFMASTYTVSKMIKASSMIALGVSINNSMWLNGNGYGSGSARLNTTTPWTSLGVIRLEPSASVGTYMSGTVIVERLA
jgi:hypothetical protein